MRRLQGVPKFQKQREEPIELAGFWAHARPKYYEARARAIRRHAIRRSGRLDSFASSKGPFAKRDRGPHCVRRVRSSSSATVFKRIQKALYTLKPRYLPKSSMVKAVAYALEQLERLQAFLGNGVVEIDNNLVENAIRPTKLDLKN
ncbi:transposase [Pelagicoccus enzymogenes]|uniref:IS66 family transposase n=1 Tax=Pelagicoccus enzymogenes TaxID=2773457 RepID=UPI00280F91D8|nr:transposase [Pelagicoccus enzymogenes]MDQ8201273.1 transposase [Pelagicoccus enzymogenes]